MMVSDSHNCIHFPHNCTQLQLPACQTTDPSFGLRPIVQASQPQEMGQLSEILGWGNFLLNDIIYNLSGENNEAE